MAHQQVMGSIGPQIETKRILNMVGVITKFEALLAWDWKFGQIGYIMKKLDR